MKDDIPKTAYFSQCDASTTLLSARFHSRNLSLASDLIQPKSFHPFRSPQHPERSVSYSSWKLFIRKKVGPEINQVASLSWWQEALQHHIIHIQGFIIVNATSILFFLLACSSAFPTTCLSKSNRFLGCRFAQ